MADKKLLGLLFGIFLLVGISLVSSAPPNVSVSSPLNKTYNIGELLFNVTSTDDSSSVICYYTLDNWENNITMTNISTIYTHTNTSIGKKSYLVNFACNDSAGAVNNTFNVGFTINWGGILKGLFKLDENQGIIAYDVEGTNNGTITGATWMDDGINITLVENTDYKLTNGDFQIIDINYAWNQIFTNYSYNYDGKVRTEINKTILGLATFADFWEIIVLAIIISIVIGLLLVMFGRNGRR